MSDPSCEDIRARLMLFAAGDLDEQDSGDISAHLSECDECRRRFVEACACWDRLSLEVRPPSPEFRRQAQEIIQESLERLCGSPSRGASFRRLTSRPFRTFGTAAAAILVVVSAVWLCQTLDFAGRDAVDRPGDRGRAGLPGTGNHERQAGTSETGQSREQDAARREEVAKEKRGRAAARSRNQTLRELAEERGGKLKRAQQALREAGKSNPDGALVPEPLIADLKSVVASGEASYWERLEAAKLLYRARDLNGDLEKYAQAFAAYLDLVGQKAGPKARMSKLVAEGSRLRRNRDFSRGIELYRSGYREAKDESTKAELLCHIGQNLEHLRDHPRALEVYRYVAATFPETRAGKDALVRIPSVYVNLSQVDKAIDAYRKCIESTSDERTKAFCLLHMGILQEHRAKRDTASLFACLSTYRGIIRDFPETVSAREARKRLGEVQSEALDHVLSIP